MSPTVEETFFGAFLDKNPDLLQKAETADELFVERPADSNSLHVKAREAEAVAEDSSFEQLVVGRSDATSFDKPLGDIPMTPAGRLLGARTEHQLDMIEQKLDEVLTILTTPKKRGRPVGTTGIKKTKTRKRRVAKKNLFVKKTLVRKKRARK